MLNAMFDLCLSEFIAGLWDLKKMYAHVHDTGYMTDLNTQKYYR